MVKLSLIIPTRNEEQIVLKHLTMISEYMKQLSNIDDYEIIICDKSEDNTPLIVKSLASKDTKIKYYDVGKKGIGAALKAGIDVASYDLLVLYDIDMAWEVNFIQHALNELVAGNDIVYGSRYLEKSHVNRPIKRKIFSTGYRILVRILFNIKIKDWNGNRGLKKSAIIKFRNKLEDDTGFFHTEMAIYAKKYHLKTKEIPANVHDLRNDSTLYVIKIASSILKRLLKKRITL